MEKQVVKNPKTNDTKAQRLYLEALDILDSYLDLVELPPTDSGNYDKEFDTMVGATARQVLERLTNTFLLPSRPLRASFRSHLYILFFFARLLPVLN